MRCAFGTTIQKKKLSLVLSHLFLPSDPVGWSSRPWGLQFPGGKNPVGVSSLSPGGLVSVWGPPGTAAPGTPCITGPWPSAPPLSGSKQTVVLAGTVGASLGHGECGFRAPACLEKLHHSPDGHAQACEQTVEGGWGSRMH